jgi:tetratricopeptide (TPR) repeat protein
MGQPKKALLDYKKAIALNPQYGELWHAKADAEYNLGRIEECLESYRMVLKLDPSNAEAWFDYGDTLYETGEIAWASEALERCVKEAPNYAPAHYTLAKIHILRREHKAAVESLSKAFSLDPQLTKQFKKDYPDLKSHRDFAPLLKK